ncbi:hypothetical protein Nmel_005229 [Mimus melanotis]
MSIFSGNRIMFMLVMCMRPVGHWTTS